MSDKYSFIVVKYPQKTTADEALKAVLGLQKEKVVKLRDAVTITKTEKGKIKLHQTKDDPRLRKVSSRAAASACSSHCCLGR